MSDENPGTEEVLVPLGDRSYRVHIVSDGTEKFGRFAVEALATHSARGCRSALVVVDGNVTALAESIARSLAASGIEPATAVVVPGEGSKSLSAASALYDRLIDLGADRGTAVVAVGGGVVGDLSGFVASTFHRGLRLLMVPTTLLGAVDSSVGGKVAVNHPRAKNVIGAFHQPAGVWIDTAQLSTLPARELRCGLAEVVKHGMILDPDLFEFIEARASDLLALEPAAIRRAIRRSCELKAGVVADDEREETGRRAILNFGHTVGHAIEAVGGYDGPYRHGEAVAAGMVAECRIAERLGWIDDRPRRRLEALLTALGLPVRAEGLEPARLLEAMRLDKKNRDGRIGFVLPRRIGAVELTTEPTDEVILAALDG